MDVIKKKKLDGFEFISFFFIFMKHNTKNIPEDKYWDYLVECFGFEKVDACDAINSHELFYFFDAMFRAFGKLLIN
jgi:hypothetical protein